MVRDWNSVKGTLYQRYVTQGQSLQQVKDVMTRQYNFVASERAYKHKIHEWGWRTNRDAGGRIATIRRRRRRQTTTPDLSNPWSTPGSFDLGDVGQHHSPEILEVGHGFEVLQQNTPPRSESDVLDQQDILGRTLLHRMAAIGEFDIVKDIVSGGARIDIPDNEGNQPLHLATIGGYSHIIRYLLKSGANVNAKGVNGRTPVHLALGLDQALRTLLGAHPNLLTPNNDGDTALHAALRMFPNKIPKTGGVIGNLLCRGANVNTMNHAGVTPFHMAIESISSCRIDSYIPLFLEHDADVHLKTKSGEWPFAFFLGYAWANRYSWREILIFLQKGADPNTQVLAEDRLLYVMLKNESWARYSGPSDIVLQLCKTANIYIPSAEGDLPLHCLMRSLYHQECVETDIERGLEAVKALLHRGSNPNQLNAKGEPPLQVLLSSHRDSPGVKIVLPTLLNHGANTMFADSSRDRPVYIAYRRSGKNDREELVKILTDAYIARPENIDVGIGQLDSIWWRTYRALRLQHWWSDEATQPLEVASNRAATGMPQDVAEHLPKLLISFAAEAKLQAAKARFSSHEVGWNSILESSNVVRILRDCKNLGIDMDVSWYHFLLEILP